MLARSAGVSAADVQSMRDGKLPLDRKLSALSALAKNLFETRGRVDPAFVEAFIAAGYRRDQALEILAISAASANTNFVSGVAIPPLDRQIEAEAWHAKCQVIRSERRRSDSTTR